MHFSTENVNHFKWWRMKVCPCSCIDLPGHQREHPFIFSTCLHPLHPTSPFIDTLFQHNLYVFFFLFSHLFFSIIYCTHWQVSIFYWRRMSKNSIIKNIFKSFKSESLPEITLSIEPQLIYLERIHFDTGFIYVITNFFP